jgi:hypothetical protein
VPAPDRQPRLAGLLSRIRQEASYRHFGTPAELNRLVRDDPAGFHPSPASHVRMLS